MCRTRFTSLQKQGLLTHYSDSAIKQKLVQRSDKSRCGREDSRNQIYDFH